MFVSHGSWLAPFKVWGSGTVSKCCRSTNWFHGICNIKCKILLPNISLEWDNNNNYNNNNNNNMVLAGVIQACSSSWYTTNRKGRGKRPDRSNDKKQQPWFIFQLMQTTVHRERIYGSGLRIQTETRDFARIGSITKWWIQIFKKWIRIHKK